MIRLTALRRLLQKLVIYLGKYLPSGAQFNIAAMQAVKKTEGTSATMYIQSIGNSPPHGQNVFERGTLKWEVKLQQKPEFAISSFLIANNRHTTLKRTV
jgi:hypothetical protein